MSYHTPAGWAERATVRDENVPHQIRIDCNQRLGGSAVLQVRCRCSLHAIAEIRTAEQALEAYRVHVSASA